MLHIVISRFSEYDQKYDWSFVTNVFDSILYGGRSFNCSFDLKNDSVMSVDIDEITISDVALSYLNTLNKELRSFRFAFLDTFSLSF